MTLSRLGHYNVLDRIGAGGMGEVYRARDTKLGRTVAIKVLPDAIAADHDRRERFLREARATAALSHPNIAMLFEVGQDGDRIYLVFEYVAGRTLGAAIAGRPLAPRLALDLSIQIADALADAHTVGIVHRDITPDNVMVTPKEKAKVLDFGLAHWTEGGLAREHAPTMAATASGPIFGTIAYMSPEQALGMTLDGRSDIFSLGVVLYEMLTGANPFAAESPTAALLNVAQKRPQLPSNVIKTLPRELDPILMKMLAKDPNHRYDSAASLAAELRSVATVLDIRSGEAEPRTVKKTARARRRPSWKAIVAAVAIVLAGAAAWRWGGADARRVWRRYVAAPLPPRIAVLPLEERAAGDRTYFADGLTEDLITRLGQVQGLAVLGRSATREMRGISPAEASKRLNVEAVLTGSVQREAGELKVSLELVDPDDGVVVWSQRYTRAIDSVFAVQAAIADDVAQALRLKLAGDLRQRTAARQVSVRAYDLYLQARDAVARRDLGTAIGLFRQALSLDGGLAEAHAGLAEAVYLQASFERRHFDATLRREVADAAARATAIDPDLAAAELAAGLADPRLAESLRHMRRAVSLDPSYAEAYHQIGDHVLGFDPSMAIDFYERSQELDRNIVASYLDLAAAHAALGNFAEAHRQIARLRESQATPLGPALQGWAAGQDAVVTFQSGDAKAAVAQMESLSSPDANQPPSAIVTFARALLAAGRRSDAQRVIEELGPRLQADCDARAVAVGLLADARRMREAKTLVGSPPRTSSDGTADERCAALLAAGLGEADGAAAALLRLSKNATAMREWTMIVTGVSDHVALRRRWYPWTRVVGQPAMADAENALEAARIDMRNVARTELAGLLR
jgi:TolB-like protein